MSSFHSARWRSVSILSTALPAWSIFLWEKAPLSRSGRSLFRQLGQYGVSIYEQHFAALETAGDLEVLENGAAILRSTALYSSETGLSLKADSGKGLFI